MWCSPWWITQLTQALSLKRRSTEATTRISELSSELKAAHKWVESCTRWSNTPNPRWTEGSFYIFRHENTGKLLFRHIVFPSEVLLFNSLTPKISWGETIVTVWLAATSLKPLQQLAQTSLSHDLSLRTQCLIEVSSSGQSNIPTPNGRTHQLWSPPTAITTESSSTSLASLTGSTSDQLELINQIVICQKTLTRRTVRRWGINSHLHMNEGRWLLSQWGKICFVVFNC